MIDRFLYWGNHVEAKSGKIKGSCQPPLSFIFLVFNRVNVIKSEAKAAAIKVQAVCAFAEHSSEVFNFDRDFKTSFESRLLFSRQKIPYKQLQHLTREVAQLVRHFR